MKHRSLIRVIAAVLVAGVVASPCAAYTPQQPKQSSWQKLEPQLLAWQTKQADKSLLDGLDGLVELEKLVAAAQPKAYGPQAIAFRQEQARRWTEQLAKVALALPMTTGQFETDLSLFVLLNADQTTGPANLAAGFAPRLMRSRIAFCDGFVATEPSGDVFDKTWARMNWIADLYADNPHGVSQGALLAGLWEARRQWQHEVETEPYDEFRHAWGHILTDLLHNPVRRDSSLFQTFKRVMLLHEHYASRFQEPAPLTERFAQLLSAIDELGKSDNSRTAEYAREAWWNVKRGIDHVWARDEDPVRRKLLWAMSDECLDVYRAESPRWRTAQAGVLATASDWRIIVQAAQRFEQTRDEPLHARIQYFEGLLPDFYRFGRCYQAVLNELAKPLQEQLQQEARDLHEGGSTALALMRWLEAEQLAYAESRQLDKEPSSHGYDTNCPPRVDVYHFEHNMHRLYVETQTLTRSKLERKLGCRLKHTVGAAKATVMQLIKASLQDRDLPPQELAARQWFHGLPAQPPQRLKQRATHPLTLYKMVEQVVDGLAAAQLVIDQLRWRAESTATTKLPANYHVARLQPVWSAYIRAYGPGAMHELLLQPLFEDNPDALRIVIDSVPESMRAELGKLVGL